MIKRLIKKFVSDEMTPRPANCESLVNVKLNQPVWDALNFSARNVDLKLQENGRAFIKASVKITNGLDNLYQGVPLSKLGDIRCTKCRNLTLEVTPPHPHR